MCFVVTVNDGHGNLQLDAPGLPILLSLSMMAAESYDAGRFSNFSSWFLSMMTVKEVLYSLV
jgi:hypothetical protein